MKQFDRYLRSDSSYMLHERCGNLGVQAQHEAEREAEHGSLILAQRCQRVIHDFAAEHRIMPDEARILLLDTGVRL